MVTALDRTWHPEHFFCAQCGAFFGPDGMILSLLCDVLYSWAIPDFKFLNCSIKVILSNVFQIPVLTYPCYGQARQHVMPLIQWK